VSLESAGNIIERAASEDPMSNQMNGGWSNRRKASVGGALGVLASIATILTFLNSSSASQPQPQNSPISSVSTTGTASPIGPAYPPSAQDDIVSECVQNTGAPASYCKCNVGWLEANIPYSMFVQDPATFEREADGYASCLPEAQITGENRATPERVRVSVSTWLRLGFRWPSARHATIRTAGTGPSGAATRTPRLAASWPGNT
jgi:hypothetical protein